MYSIRHTKHGCILNADSSPKSRSIPHHEILEDLPSFEIISIKIVSIKEVDPPSLISLVWEEFGKYIVEILRINR